MSASWDKWEESFHTVKKANLTVYCLIRWINKFVQNCQWRSYIKRQNISRTLEGRHNRDKHLWRTRDCFLDISLLFFFLVTSWLSRAVASFWTSGVSSWVPLMTLLSAARDWWILWKNILRLVLIPLVPGLSFSQLIGAERFTRADMLLIRLVCSKWMFLHQRIFGIN